MSKNIKSVLLANCMDFIEEKYSTLLSEYRIYQDSAANETKSTAGDKHDTSKSMMQLEQEKLGQQLKFLQQQKQVLEGLDVGRVYKKIEFGAVVETDHGNFFLSIPAKEIKIERRIYMPVSVQSPLAKIFMNKQPGDEAGFNGKTYHIQAVY
jgi:hypothetical protein